MSTNGRPSAARAEAEEETHSAKFQETARWKHDEHSKDDIEDFARSELKMSTIVLVWLSCQELTSNETIAMVFL